MNPIAICVTIVTTGSSSTTITIIKDTNAIDTLTTDRHHRHPRQIRPPKGEMELKYIRLLQESPV